MDVKGRVVLISGASSGIGARLAVEIGRRGARGVVLLARRQEMLDQVAEEVKQTGAESLTIAADVGDDQSVVGAISRAEEHFGQLDVVVANAGVGTRISPLEPNQAGLNHLININFLGAGRLIHAALPSMLKRRQGQLVAVASLAGYRGMPNGAAYCSAKAALIALMESYRLELHDAGIVVSTVLPGFVRTAMTEENDLEMPGAVTADEAAHFIADGIERGQAEICFPFMTSVFMSWLKMWPNFIYDFVMRMMLKRKAARRKK